MLVYTQGESKSASNLARVSQACECFTVCSRSISHRVWADPQARGPRRTSRGRVSTCGTCSKGGRDKCQLAWAQAHLFRLMAVVGYPEPHLAAVLADARRCVTGSGDAHVMAYLHDSVATMEAQRGHTVEAERHLRLARGLLQMQPSSWLEELLALNAACVAIIKCDTDSFDRYLATARTSARLTGNVSTTAAIDINEAHAAVVTGRFTGPLRCLQKIVRSPLSIHNELAARESLIRMHLAMGRVAECEAELAKLEARRPDGLTLNLLFRGAAILKVRLLIRKGEHAAAAASCPVSHQRIPQGQ